jgi:transcription elongation factor Elf1
MSNRYEIHCINCGEQVKKVRSSDKEASVRVDCPKCHTSSIVNLLDNKNTDQVTVEIFADKKTVWRKTDSSQEPIFTCIFCGHFGLRRLDEETNIFKCSGLNCKRVIEVMYT